MKSGLVKTLIIIGIIVIFVFIYFNRVNVNYKFVESVLATSPTVIVYEWTKTMGGTLEDNGIDIEFDNENNIILTGYFRGTNVDFDPGTGTDLFSVNGTGDDGFVTKFSSTGEYLWTRQLGSAINKIDRVSSISTDSLNNIYITLTTYASGSIDIDPTAGVDNRTLGGEDSILISLDSNGAYRWGRTIGYFTGGYGGAYIGGLDVTNDSVYITGRYYGVNINFDREGSNDLKNSGGGNDNTFFSKINLNGTYDWTKTFDGNAYTNGDSIVADNDGNIYIAGFFENGGVDFDPGIGTDIRTPNGNADPYLVKLNGDGNHLWTKVVSIASQNWGLTLNLDNNGHIYLRDDNEYVRQLNVSDGSENWLVLTAGVDMPSFDYGTKSIVTDTLNNLYITGRFTGTFDFNPGSGVDSKTSSNQDMYLTMFKEDGTYGWTKVTKGINGGGWSLDINDIGELYISGYFNNATADFDLIDSTDLKATNGNKDIFLTKLMVDILPPSLTLDSTTSYTTQSPVITGTVTDTHSSVSSVEYQLDGTGGSWLGCLAEDGSYNSPNENYYCVLPLIVDGSHVIYVRGIDINNNVNLSYTSKAFVSGVVIPEPPDVTAPTKVIITKLGLISNIPDKDKLTYYFTSQTPFIKGIAEANSRVYFSTSSKIYSANVDSSGNFSINITNPSLSRTTNTLTYYAMDASGNKSTERVLVLIIGKENFPTSYTTTSSSASFESINTISITSSTDVKSKSSLINSQKPQESGKKVTLILKIVDDNNQAYINSLVKLKTGEKIVRILNTNENGEIGLLGLVLGVYTVEIEKDGNVTNKDLILTTSDIKDYNDQISKTVILSKQQNKNLLPLIAIIILILTLSIIGIFIFTKVRKSSNV